MVQRGQSLALHANQSGFKLGADNVSVRSVSVGNGKHLTYSIVETIKLGLNRNSRRRSD